MIFHHPWSSINFHHLPASKFSATTLKPGIRCRNRSGPIFPPCHEPTCTWQAEGCRRLAMRNRGKPWNNLKGTRWCPCSLAKVVENPRYQYLPQIPSSMNNYSCKLSCTSYKPTSRTIWGTLQARILRFSHGGNRVCPAEAKLFWVSEIYEICHHW